MFVYNYFYSKNTNTNDEKVSKRQYGWKKPISYHNFTYHIHNELYFINNIKLVDLRDKCPPIYDQGDLGSCTANAIAAAFEFDEMNQYEKSTVYIPSRLFIYYNERLLENSTDSDSGASIADSVKSIVKYGVCPETQWPYDINKFTDKPDDKCYEIGKKNYCKTYKLLQQDLNQMKQSIIDGFPFVFGINIYESFESENVKNTGNVPMPNISNEKLLGGHAVMAVMFDDDKKVFGCRNSWGTNWGDKGHFYLPYDYILNSELASDFWIITSLNLDDEYKYYEEEYIDDNDDYFDYNNNNNENDKKSK